MKLTALQSTRIVIAQSVLVSFTDLDYRRYVDACAASSPILRRLPPTRFALTSPHLQHHSTSPLLTLSSTMASPQSEGHIPQTPDGSTPRPLSGSSATTWKQGQLKRAGIDERIRVLEVGLSAWQSYRNSALPVASLPPEILTAIFLYVTETDAPFANKYLGGLRPRGSLGWIKVTHVCRGWRQVALRTPLLWRNIVQLQAGGTEMMLQRAARVLLRVIVDINPRRFRSQLALLQKPTSRLQVLALRMFPKSGSSVALVPHTWLRNAQDSMRHLSLDSVYCDWGWLRFPAMVHLELSYPGSIERQADIKHLPTVSMLASALATMPNLQTLSLRNAISPRSLSKDSTNPVIRTPLPNLSWLDINMGMELCTLLLRHLAIPHEADIGIFSSDVEPDIQHLTAQLDELQDYLVTFQSHAAPAFYLTIACHEWRAEVHARGPAAGSFEGVFCIDNPYAEGMTALLHRLPLVDADYLELGPFHFNTPSLPDWDQIFGTINLKLRKACTVKIDLGGRCNGLEPSHDVLLALLERGPQMMPLLETLVICIIFLNDMPDRESFRGRLDAFACASSLKTIEVHTDAYTRESMTRTGYMDGVRPEVRYVVSEE
ncbi:hypothetical protein EVG20_g5783 [Dentipellis fragilis]|uniref:F-box domain-containing protein n=1 Tax=Dentipellis fragilis TaxID=205917 RepID=A0A4Y9YQQ4_9AGAM|nr:hypothetical protein EVG20_g5783 [Dentipellis fragilis]